jgi:CRP-like cAMP-binding protein
MAKYLSTTHTPIVEWESIFRSCLPLRISYAPGEMISQAGSYIAGIHLIAEGVVSDTIPSSRGVQSHVDVLAAGDLIGLEILAHHAKSISSSRCRALTSVELLFVDTSQWMSTMDTDSMLERSLLHYVVTRHMRVREASRHSVSVDAQLCRLLQRLADCCIVSQDTGVVELPAEITLQMLGDLLGMSSRQLRQARQHIQSLTKGDACITFELAEIRQIAGGI